MLNSIKKPNYKYYLVQSISMEGKERELTIKKMIEQYQYINGTLANKFLQINSKNNGQFILTKCFMRPKYIFMGFGSQCLFFTNSNKAKNRWLVGFLQITDKKVDDKSAKCFQDFVENTLLFRSSYLQNNAIKQIKYDDGQEMAIRFKKQAQQKQWRLQFVIAEIAQIWMEKLTEIINMNKKTSEIPHKVDKNQKLGTVSPNQSTQKQLIDLIKSGVGSQQQIEKILRAVTVMSKLPVQLTVYIISKIKSAVLNKQMEIKELQQKNAQLQGKLNQKQNQNIAIQTQLNQLRIKYQQLQPQIKRIKEKAVNLQLKNRQLSQQNLSHQIKIDELNASFLTQTVQRDHLQTKINEHLQSTSLLQQDKSLLGNKLNDANRQLTNVTSELSAAISVVSKLNLILVQKNIKLATLGKQLAESNQTLNHQKIQIQRLIQQNRISLESKQAQIRNLSDNLQRLNLYIESIDNQAQLMTKQDYSQLFQGQILHGCLQQKRFLCRQIQKCSKRFIKDTNLIYCFDNNKINFHKFIDQHSCICLVIRLQNGILIAGYSQDAFSPTKPATKGGVICSLNSKTAFTLFKGCRSVTYDAQFLIFGNNQLRIKKGQLTLESNFAQSKGYYDSRDKDYTALMGKDSQRAQRIQNYQIFEVQFS